MWRFGKLILIANFSSNWKPKYCIGKFWSRHLDADKKLLEARILCMLVNYQCKAFGRMEKIVIGQNIIYACELSMQLGISSVVYQCICESKHLRISWLVYQCSFNAKHLWINAFGEHFGGVSVHFWNKAFVSQYICRSFWWCLSEFSKQNIYISFLTYFTTSRRLPGKISHRFFGSRKFPIQFQTRFQLTSVVHFDFFHKNQTYLSQTFPRSL